MLPPVEPTIPDIRQLGQAVQELLDEKGWKKGQFAEAAQVDVAHLSRAQNHGRNLTWATLTSIARTLDMSVSELALRAESIAERERAPEEGGDDV
jgi:transcriptional regulator with XRE-family HTH domain